MTAASIRIGTSGWAYDHWKGPFYPPHIGSDAMLAEYARHFDTVELNSTFYRLPAPETLERWADSVPAGFTFAVKASRYITHIKKLKDSAETLPPFLERVRLLGDCLGPVLFQLPPRFHYNGARLEALLDQLPDDLACAFEFRDETWFNQETFELLDSRGAALCLYDLGGRTAPERPTGAFVYVRLHGPHEAYAGRYSDAALDHWAAALRGWSQDRRPCWCFFDNDAAGHAPADAQRLLSLLDRA